MTDSMVITALPIRQPIGKIFVSVLNARVLLKICEFEYRHALTDDSPDVDFMGIQRPYSPKRVKEIAKYIDTTPDATFPTAIVISIDERCVLVEEKKDGSANILLSDFIDSEDPDNSVSLSAAGRIIDGQHRLKGLEESGVQDFEVPVTIFVGADAALRAAVFSVVNLAQTKVNRSLVYDLYSVSEGRSPQKTAHEVVVALDSAATSPFRYRIKRLGFATRDIEGNLVLGRENEVLSQATVVRGLLKHITRDPMIDLKAERNNMPIRILPSDRETLVFRNLYGSKNDTAILINVANFFNAVKDRWPVAWDDFSQGNMLNRTNGFDGLNRFLGVAYFRLANETKVVSKSDYKSVLDRVPLKSSDFTIDRFPPGTGGASALFKALQGAFE